MKQLYPWCAVMLIVVTSTCGDVLLSRAMKEVGDVHALLRSHGFSGVMRRVFSTPAFFLGILAMSIAFYSLLFGLSWGDVSFVVPASSSLTFVANALAAKIFLHEHVDRRRWIAALLVAGGVVLLAI
jgi:drug/metabolite transporter (DMT)-like permease